VRVSAIFAEATSANVVGATGASSLLARRVDVVEAIVSILHAATVTSQSDAAVALRRVTGLTLVNSRFIYVRGLGERYSSVLLNGASIPSPDPTRRVIPLDLFPTDVLEGVVVQKTYTADMPGEFGGGTIQLRTKAIPLQPFFRASVTVGGEQGTTFSHPAPAPPWAARRCPAARSCRGRLRR
jgi:hypothetical protein